MTTLTLVIGNKNYSSWSLRPWLLLKHHQIAFNEVRIPLYMADSAESLKKLSPSGKVPVLIDGDLIIWDSLAICEYIADLYPQYECWPIDLRLRATARSMCAEMHSGFQDLRNHFPMNIRKRLAWNSAPSTVLQDIERITSLWTCCLERYRNDGPWLFGKFSIADVMYAPVAWRFITYSVPVNDICKEYIGSLLTLPEMQEWVEEASAEKEVIAASERARVEI